MLNMKAFNFCFSVISLMILFSSHIFAELIKYQSCTHASSSSCEILNITINPCPEAEKNQPCNFRRGTNSTLTLYFKPKFSGTNMQVQRYSEHLINGTMQEMLDPSYHDHDGCLFISPACPVVAEHTYKFHYIVNILDSFAPGVYSGTWKMWNENKEECCFKSPSTVV